MFTSILVAVDASSRSGRILTEVEDLARATGAAVHVLHADESEVVYDQMVELEDGATAAATVDQAVARLRAAGLTADGEVVEVLHENVPYAVLERARALRADLVVLGPRHHGRIGALLGGSVTHEVSLHTPVSLLLVV
ncbi:universal stress protein [Microbispora corallina]|uniref:Universal stress protein n=1 Tax=Microbispora corallina TaxID=83302 RepID=A0ABQ4G3E2_9ACTN|nr:universal stress protein [Microbispora corallina]GIH41555.1 universal stress protein [Microbispora corallina]